MKTAKCSRDGFTLVEVLITAAVTSIVTVGLIQLFIYCSMLSQLAGNLTNATTDALTRLEEIRDHDYDLVTTDYASGGTPGNTFDPTQGTGKGIIYIDASNTDLLQIEIDISFQNKNGRIVGEDTDIDGVLDAGEDTDGDGKLTSPVKLISLVARR